MLFLILSYHQAQDLVLLWALLIPFTAAVFSSKMSLGNNTNQPV